MKRSLKIVFSGLFVFLIVSAFAVQNINTSHVDLSNPYELATDTTKAKTQSTTSEKKCEPATSNKETAPKAESKNCSKSCSKTCKGSRPSN